jgi:hypothetical protein
MVGAIMQGVGNAMRGIGDSISAGLNFAAVKRQIKSDQAMQAKEHDFMLDYLYKDRAWQNRDMANNLFATDNTMLWILAAIVVVIIIIVMFSSLAKK